MAFKVTVDEQKCIGCGACTSASDNFKIEDTDNGPKAKVIKANVEDAKKEKEAAELCPVDAISVEEA